MQWNDHSRDIPRDAHAFLSPSKHNFLKYSREDLYRAYRSQYATKIGTLLHAAAEECINKRIKLNKRDEHLIKFHLGMNGIPENAYDVKPILENLCNYVTDGIGFRMQAEQKLKYSDNCFGTADTIQYYEKQRLLRIHDLKTGVMPASMIQLEIYAALFHLEYDKFLNITPQTIDTILCIYQNGEVVEERHDPEAITDIMHWLEEKNDWTDEFVNGGVL